MPLSSPVPAKTPFFIYIIDDDIEDIEMLSTTINEINSEIQFQYSHNGIDALKDISGLQLRPDIILLDLNMPRMDDKSFLREIRGDEYLSKIPVIIYSTSTFEKDKHETAELGAVSYMEKPNTYSGLCTVVKTLLANAG